MKHKETIKEYKRRIRKNINQVKRIAKAKPSGVYQQHYPYLYALLQNSKELGLIIDILELNYKHKGTILQNKCLFFMSTRFLTTHNNSFKAIQSVNNRLNFYCCIGLFDKINYIQLQEVKQNRAEYFYYIANNINHNRPINLFFMRLYSNYQTSTDYLQEIELRLAELTELGITPSNCSYKLLGARGLFQYRDRVYHSQNYTSAEEDKWHRDLMIDFINNQIEARGYCYKSDLYSCLDFRENKKANENRINKLFKLYDFKNKYIYKAPDEEEQDKLGLTSAKYILLKK